jgi:hypothetical protein
MHSSRLITCLAHIALAVLCSPILSAQNPAPPKGGVAKGAECNCEDAEASKPAREPYTAVKKTTRVQKLANGVTITHETSGKEARDSSGRTYRESQLETTFTSENPAIKVVTYNVQDPVNRLTISWNSNSKEAIVFHLPEPNQARLSPPVLPTSAPAPGTVLGAVFSVAGMSSPPPAKKPQTIREDLGIKTINSVEAKGTRRTLTYPAGSVGNDQPLSVTQETWISRDLKVVVLQIDDDPRTGTRTTELTEIERGEPDPALFQPPEGYTVKDRFQGQQN